MYSGRECLCPQLDLGEGDRELFVACDVYCIQVHKLCNSYSTLCLQFVYIVQCTYISYTFRTLRCIVGEQCSSI